MRDVLICLLSLCVGILLGMMLMRSCSKPQIPEPKVIRDTTLITQIDTQYFPKPVPYKLEVRDRVYIDNSFQNDKDWKVFVQGVKEYRDSTYYARVSGINAFLEEIRVYPRITTKYITTTEYVRGKPKKWGIGVIGGYGIGSSGLKPYIGFGISYDIIQF